MLVWCGVRECVVCVCGVRVVCVWCACGVRGCLPSVDDHPCMERPGQRCGRCRQYSRLSADAHLCSSGPGRTRKQCEVSAVCTDCSHPAPSLGTPLPATTTPHV